VVYLFSNELRRRGALHQPTSKKDKLWRMRQQTKKQRMRRSETREECKGKQALVKLERNHRNRV